MQFTAQNTVQLPNLSILATPKNDSKKNDEREQLVYGQISFSAIKSFGHTLQFKTPYSLYVTMENEQYCVEDPFLSLFAYGDTLDDLLNEVACEFSFLWEHIAMESDQNLTGDAISVKKWLINNIDVQEDTQ